MQSKVSLILYPSHLEVADYLIITRSSGKDIYIYSIYIDKRGKDTEKVSKYY